MHFIEFYFILLSFCLYIKFFILLYVIIYFLFFYSNVL